MNRPNKYRAKLKNRDQFIEGYYFEMKDTTYCFKEDYERFPVETHYYLVCETMVDWGLPNEIRIYEIEEETLEEIKDSECYE